MIDEKFRYFAFISYKREDEKWAKWLHHKLEHYRLPSKLSGRNDLPNAIRPIFRDTSELSVGNLPNQINEALTLSKYLIVICSPRSAQSRWVNKEVEFFLSMGKAEYIIPFIIDGTPFASVPDEECFPNAILTLPQELEIVGANINEMGRDAAAVKIVSRMFELQFDELWQRHERELRRRRHIITSAVAVFMIAVLSVAGWIWHQNQELEKKNYQVMLGQSRYVAGAASKLCDNGETYLARLLALEVLQNNPYTPEAEAALRKACLGNSTILSDNIYPTLAIYSPQGKWVAAIAQDSLDAPCNLYLWESSCGKLVFVISTQQEHVKDLAFNALEDIVQTIDNEGNIKQWKVPEGIINERKVTVISRDFQIPEVFGPQAPFADPLALSAVFSPDSSMIIVAYRDGVARLWDNTTHQCIQTFDEEDLAVWGVDFCPDGRRLLIAANRCLRIRDIKERLSYISLERYESPVWRIVFSPNDKYLLSIYGGDIVCCWSLSDGKLLWEFDDEDYYGILNTIEFVNGDAEIQMLFTEGSRMILSAADGTRRSLSKVKVSAIDYAETGNTEAFSPDGKTKAVVKDDRNVVIYTADSNEEICFLHKDDQNDIHAEVLSVAYSHDGRRIAVGMMNGCLRIYEFPPLRELVDNNRNRFKNRPLTLEERRRFYLE